jgi:adenine-specific DNA-methyltransferase
MPKEDFDEWSKEDLIKEVKKLKKRKKYGIVWDEEHTKEKFEKEAEGNLPVLKEIQNKEIKTDENKPINILIEGDNFHALSVLNYTHDKAVDVIYIDPPYNTGSEGFVFNDKIVDREDAYRHSKWLSFMSKRLKLARTLLKKSGIIFISINDIEIAQLKSLMDEIFIEDNFVALLVWENKEGGGSSDSKFFKIKHEYILSYAKNIDFLEIKGVGIEDEDRYSLEDKHVKERGKYQLIKLNSASIQYSKSLDYPIKAQDGTKILPSYGQKRACWRWSKNKLEWGIKNDFVVIKKDKNRKWAVYTKQYLNVDNEGNLLKREKRPIGVIAKYSSTMATKQLENMFGKKVFNYPKPYQLIKYLLELSSDKNSIVLDFFAGTGTTAQSVLELNKEDKGNRKFILCTNNENNICTEVCYPRIEKVINGYIGYLDKIKHEGIKDNLKYFKTAFVEGESTDKNKRKLVDQSTEMLCLKEDCFYELKAGRGFKIFQNKEKYLGIIYDDDAIDGFKKEAKKLNVKFVVYVFSLDESAHEEEFEDMKNKVELKPIPEVILNVYRRIFK